MKSSLKPSFYFHEPDDSAIEGDSAPPPANTLGGSTGRDTGGSNLRINEIAGVGIADDPQARKKPWLTLVSYVDELTVGGRRDSKGHYVDGLGRFPGFGRDCKDRTPHDCLPPNCFHR